MILFSCEIIAIVLQEFSYLRPSQREKWRNKRVVQEKETSLHSTKGINKIKAMNNQRDNKQDVPTEAVPSSLGSFFG